MAAEEDREISRSQRGALTALIREMPRPDKLLSSAAQKSAVFSHKRPAESTTAGRPQRRNAETNRPRKSQSLWSPGPSGDVTICVHQGTFLDARKVRVQVCGSKHLDGLKQHLKASWRRTLLVATRVLVCHEIFHLSSTINATSSAPGRTRQPGNDGVK